jgi:hypothetical protein
MNFSWFDGLQHCGPTADGEQLRLDDTQINIHLSRPQLDNRLTGENQENLLVAMYAWDSTMNSAMACSPPPVTPAAACCSNIPELQNPDVNPQVSGNHTLAFNHKQGPRPLNR